MGQPSALQRGIILRLRQAQFTIGEIDPHAPEQAQGIDPEQQRGPVAQPQPRKGCRIRKRDGQIGKGDLAELNLPDLVLAGYRMLVTAV